MRTEILFEDRHVLVVYKPAGLAVQSAKVGQMDVVSELKNYLRRSEGNEKGREQKAPYLGVIHRLDQPVEGLLVFAKSKKAAEVLSAQLQKQGEEVTLHKQYCAVLCGDALSGEGELVDYLYKGKDNKAAVVDRREAAGAKRAVLRYRIIQTRTDISGVLALGDIRIETGRFHQIRAQMAHAGMPLLGDQKYGDQDTKALSKRLEISHVALCAQGLAFRHPVTNQAMHFEIKPKGKAFTFFCI